MFFSDSSTSYYDLQHNLQSKFCELKPSLTKTVVERASTILLGTEFYSTHFWKQKWGVVSNGEDWDRVVFGFCLFVFCCVFFLAEEATNFLDV